MGRPAVNVVFITDQKYANLTAVAIRSLVVEFEKSPGSREFRLDIYVVCVDVAEEGRSDLARAAAPEVSNSQVSLTLVEHVLSGNPQGRQRWLQLVSLKVYLPGILPQLDRAIFLDSDIVVLDDIAKLWLIDLEGHWLGVVPGLTDHPLCLRNFNTFKIKYRNATEPINAGVLLLDLARMRKLDVTQTLADWQQANLDKLKNPEQEAISMNYSGQWKALPHEWNFRAFGEPCWTASSWDEYKVYLAKRPSIVHFQDGGRPTVLNIRLPYADRWLRHYRHINAGRTPDSKTLGYFYFIYFEYPDLCGRAANYLPRPGGLLRYFLVTALVGLCIWPVALPRYLQYRKHPDSYELRVDSLLDRNSMSESVRNQCIGGITAKPRTSTGTV